MHLDLVTCVKAELEAPKIAAIFTSCFRSSRVGGPLITEKKDIIPWRR